MRVASDPSSVDPPPVFSRALALPHRAQTRLVNSTFGWLQFWQSQVLASGFMDISFKSALPLSDEKVRLIDRNGKEGRGIDRFELIGIGLLVGSSTKIPAFVAGTLEDFI